MGALCTKKTEHTSEEKEEDIFLSFKIILLGNPNVGKTSIIRFFTEGQFSEERIVTMDEEYTVKTIQIDGNYAKLKIWDTAGQENFSHLTHSYFREADGVLLIFDISDPESFKSLDSWMGDVEKWTSNQRSILLVGNKTDLERVVTSQEAEAYAKASNLQYVETSAKEGRNIEECFLSLSRLIVANNTVNT